jgi:3-carboxy-cis,cis-muconate cycloisomerase
MTSIASTRMYDPLFSTPEMISALRDTEFFRAMLQVEVALAEAEEECGVVPGGISAALRDIQIEDLDLTQICNAATFSGNLCIPFVKTLTSAVQQLHPKAADYVHWGATSQDVQDTALLLQLRVGWQIVQRDLNVLCSSIADRIAALPEEPMAGRTWLQQGPPVTLRLKMATWLDALQRHRERASEAQDRIFALQFGGAVGTLASLRESGQRVAAAMAERLSLSLPSIPWHTQRDRIAELATLLGMLCGSLGKIARDVSLLMQNEVAEFLEPDGEGRGGSSTMPHKRNPVGCAVMLSAATRTPGLVSGTLSAMVQEHERGLGSWQSEWEPLTELLRLTAGSIARGTETVREGVISVSSMQRNLTLLRGVPMAEAVTFVLAEKIGKTRAHNLVQQVSGRALSSGHSLLEELKSEPGIAAHLSPEELAQLVRPENYLGSARGFVEAVLEQETKWRTNASR